MRNGICMGLLNYWHFVKLNLIIRARDPILVRIVSTDLDFGTQRLIRCRSGLRFGGVVHETIMIGTRYKTPDTVYFELRPGRYGWKKRKNVGSEIKSY